MTDEGITSTDLLSPSIALNEDDTFTDQDADLRHASATADSKTETRHGVRMGKLGLLLPINSIGELLDKQSYCSLPNTAHTLLGVISLRGQIIPVFDMYQILDFQKPDTAITRLLIITVQQLAVAIEVFDLPEKVVLTKEDKTHALPPLPEPIRNCVSACYNKEQLWVDWDVLSFFEIQGQQISA